MLDFILLHGSHGSHLLSYSKRPIILGLIMSMLHVISVPDHLTAFTPLTIESKIDYGQ
jgi:hypothetical protein